VNHFYIQRSTGFIDEISDSEVLADRIPRYSQRFEALKEIREASEDMWSYTTYGRQHISGGTRRVASIPEPLLSRLLEIEPDFLINKPKFFRWLDKNPDYATYRRARASA
jgi:hypothetical protein